MNVTAARVRAFQLHFHKRMLRIAQLLGNSFTADADGDELSESGFIILAIGMMYFEPIAMFLEGEESKGKSGTFFKLGFRTVFPVTVVTDDDLELLWDSTRNGLFHCGMPKLRCQLSRWPSTAFSKDGNVLVVNPPRLIDAISTHFAAYCDQLNDASNHSLRSAFDKTYSRFEGFASVSSLTKTTTTPEPCSPLHMS